VKSIYIVRHAKAGDHSANRDFERELTERGRMDAAKMAKALAEKVSGVDLILTSPAARTLATAGAMAAGLSFPQNKIVSDRRLYNAEEGAILNVIREVGDNFHSVLLVGHNPGLTDFVNGALGTMITSIATSGVVHGILAIDSWEELNWRKGTLKFYIDPDDVRE
jgi:phosphohistidine phosphatase